MPRYIIHIGPMKTGSTYLQHCLAGSIDALREQGVYYPRELLDPRNNTMHLPVFYGLGENARSELRPIFEKINAEGHETVVLSCEHFSLMSPLKLKRLRDVVGVEDVQVVYFCRRWSDRIRSIWFQKLSEGAIDNLPEFYLKLLSEQKSSRDIDYTLLWDRLVEIYGRSNLRLFPYSTVMDAREDIFVRFCTDILGIGSIPQPGKLGKKQWGSFGTTEAELLRALNDLHTRERGDPGLLMFRHMTRGLKRIGLSPIVEAMKPDVAAVPIGDTAVHYDAVYDKMNTYADLLTGPSSDTTVFSRKQAQEEYVRPGYLAAEGVAEALRTMCDEFSEAPARRQKVEAVAPEAATREIVPAEAAAGKAMKKGKLRALRRRERQLV